MTNALMSRLTILIITALFFTTSAAAQSGAVRRPVARPAIGSVTPSAPIEPKAAEEDNSGGQPIPGNSLSPTAKIVIAASIIAAVTVITVTRRKKRVCGPLSGCPLF